MSNGNLWKLFGPRSVAVVGASTEPGTVGNDIAKNLVEGPYEGEVFLVNPKTDRLLGRKCHPDVASIGAVPDLAIIVVPAAIVPNVLRQAGELGVPAAVVISAGFRETGEFGRKLETEVADIAKKHDMALLGPNCLGFLDPYWKLNASFAPYLPEAGSVAFFSQSGALMTAILDITRTKMGFSKVISSGNKAVLDEHDLIAFLRDDPKTKVISFYTEGISDAASFVSLGRELVRLPVPKPLVVLKSGRTESGMKASVSHTGALAGSDASYDALFRQARAIRTESMREFLDALTVFSENPVPDGNDIAIVTNAGGPGVLAADAAAKAGLSLPPLSESSRDRLLAKLPKAASVENPIDILGDARSDRYALALEVAASDPATDAILVVITPQSMTEAEMTARAIAETRDRHRKPIVAVLAGDRQLARARDVLRDRRISTFGYPEEGAEALALLARVSAWHGDRKEENPTAFHDIDRERARKVIDRLRKEKRNPYEYEVYDILLAYGFPLLDHEVARNAEDAERIARKFGNRVALKIVSPDVIHKTDAGGVAINVPVENAAEEYVALLARVRKNRPKAKLEGAVVMRMAEKGGKELILGAKKEPGLGTLLLLGMGGIYTEAIRDTAFRFAPVTRTDAEEMFGELRSVKLLSGVRGEAGIDRGALSDIIERTSRLVEDFPEIEELDLNPLFAFHDASAFAIADARLVLGEGK